MFAAALRFWSVALILSGIWAAESPAEAEAARGLALAREGKYELAISHYQAAQRLDSHLPGLALNLGLAYFKSKRLPEAAATFEKAVQADGNSFQARALLGMSYYGCARYREAAVQLKLAAEIQPDNVELRYTLAQAYLWSNQYPEALAEFRFLLSKNPDSGPVHILLGEALDASNRVEEATAEFESAVRVSPHQPEVHFGLGYLYWKRKRYPEAIREFQAELSQQPQHTQAMTYLADTQMQSGDNKAAAPLLRTVLKLAPDTRLAHLDMGIILTRENQPAEAERQFRDAIRLDPSKTDAHYRLARLLSSLGREKAAQSEFEAVKQLAVEQAPPPLIRLAGPPRQ